MGPGSPPPDPTSVGQLRQLFRDHGFRPRRTLGQSFLIDANIVGKLVAAAGLTGCERVLEVGAGAGSVTRALAEAALRVVAIEIDPRLVAMLEKTVGGGVEVVQEDVLAVVWEEMLGPAEGALWRVVANLPYAITGPAILRLLDARAWVDRMVIMVQDEVAERLVAEPGMRAHGLLSALVQAACTVEVKFRVAPTCFYPRPRVASSVLALEVRRPQPVPDRLAGTFREVVRGAFGTRRKHLVNALTHSRELELSKPAARELLREGRIDPTRRAETLGTEDFLRLAEAIARAREERPS